MLTWLQQTLIDACYVKVNGIDLFKEDGESLEPVPFHFNCKLKSILILYYSNPWLNRIFVARKKIMLCKYYIKDDDMCVPKKIMLDD